MRYRLARPDDASAITAIYRPFVEDSHVSFELVPPAENEMAARIEDTLARYPWLVAEEDGVVVGYAYGSPYRARLAYRWSAEVSVYLAEGARGRGVARELYERLFRLLAEQNVRTLVAGIALPNEASVRLHEKLGFTPVGNVPNIGFKLGQWIAVGFWAKEVGEGPASAPEEFIPFRDLQALGHRISL